jgi:diaminohydroxyphosphoribosylaminopyrimidine deaminase/5-amino-6-(5-phosphoribosylamino)uracil reductase
MHGADLESADDRRFMHAALAFGRRGLGLTAPNPSVAALLVKDGVVLSHAVTAPGGRPHAETQALAMAGPRARGATLYVTLEPCSHYGHTKPCADAVVAAGVARVVVAIGDPDLRVAGRGIDRLRQAGIAVTTGVLEDIARRDHLGHILRVVEHRPMVTLKLAETADGYVAAPAGEPRLLITGPAANSWVHRARAMHDAVLIGAGTARSDDPLLTVRLPGMSERQPARIVFDAHGSLAVESRLVASAGDSPVFILTGPEASPSRVEALSAAGVHVVETEVTGDGRLHLPAALTAIAGGFTRVFCEGGPRLGSSLIEAGLADEVVLLTGAKSLGKAGLPALEAKARSILHAGDRFRLVEDRRLGEDRLRRYERDETCSQA